MPSLSLWTVYDHPTDFPNSYVAREFVLDQPTQNYIASADLGLIREQLLHMGLAPLARSPEDEPQIIETWL